MKAVLLLAGLLWSSALIGVACGGGSTNEQGFTEANAERWLKRYVQELVGWKRQAESAEAPAKRGDFEKVAGS